MTYTGFRLTGRNAVVGRPPDVAQTVAGDTWARDRTNAAADDGTEIDATWVNRLRANLENVVTGLGGNMADGDAQILNAILKALEPQGHLVDTVGYAKAYFGLPSVVDPSGQTVFEEDLVSIVRAAMESGGAPAEVGTAVENSAAFAALRGGAAIDLGNRTFPVVSIPPIRAYNGAFQVGATVYPQPRQLLDHPLAGDAQVISEGQGRTTWELGFVVRQDAGQTRFYRWYLVADAHIATRPTMLKLDISDGTGFVEGRTLYSDSTWIAEPLSAFGKLGGNRMGGLLKVRNGASYKHKCIYTDDWGATIAEVDTGINTTVAGMYGNVQPWPAVAGGHDTLGFRIFAYSSSAGIYAFQTDDNGATWGTQLVRAKDGIVPLTQEPSVVQTPYGWFMYVRTGAAGHVTVAPPDMSSWTPWTPIPMTVGSNALWAVYHAGMIHLYVVYREAVSLGLAENTMWVSSAPAGEAFAADGVISAPAAPVAQFPRAATGYLQVAQMQGGHFLALLKVRELTLSSNPTTSATVLISTLAMPSQSGDLDEEEPYSFITNGDFEHWPNGTSFPALTARSETAAGWYTWHSGSAPLAVSRVDVPITAAGLLEHRPRYGLQFDNGADPDNYSGVDRSYFGDEAQRLLRLAWGRFLTATLTGHAAAPDNGLRVSIWLDAGTGGTVNGLSGPQVLGPALAFPKPRATSGAWETAILVRLDAMPTVVYGSTPPMLSFRLDVGNDGGQVVFAINGFDITTGRGRRHRARPPQAAQIAVRRLYFTADGTWTKRSGLRRIVVRGVGGGGGTPDVTAGASQVAASGGGQSGAYGEKTLLAHNVADTVAVTVGAAGTAASNAGGTSSFGAYLTLPGGNAPATLSTGTAVTDSGLGSAPVAATGADFSELGSYGGRALRLSASFGMGGAGGSTPLGRGAPGSGPARNALAPTGYGSGAGGTAAANGATQTGASGRPGIIIVEEHYA